MKIVICTTPIRPVPTEFPPFGSLAVIQALQAADYDPIFYDIDGLRPPFEEVAKFFRDEAPDLVGISAVVSTAYAYTKKLALAIKEARRDTKVVVGGNLAASAEILLRCSQVDVCVTGEGERTIVNLARFFEPRTGKGDCSGLESIKGIAFLNQQGQMVFTGYEQQLTVDELLEPDFSILGEYSKINLFVHDPLRRADFARDSRTHEPHRRGQKMTTLLSTKGCVARCTFCHRWEKGYRAFPVDKVIQRIKFLRDKCNVGFFVFGDENFASDRRQVEELVMQIKPLDVLYKVGGVRVRSVDPDLLKRMRDSGCVSVYYGMETGSPRMLKVMEKNATLEQNINAARWTHEAGIYTIYQLVLGMPGETYETIDETIEFIKRVTEYLDEPPRQRLSINFIQALPGTPVYEYARATGLIGPTLEDEERYLIQVSDVDAGADLIFLNFTEYDYLTVQSWRSKILFEAEAHYYRRRNWKAVERPAVAVTGRGEGLDDELAEDYTRGGYFNLGRMVLPPSFYRYGYWLRPLYQAAAVLKKAIMMFPPGKVLLLLSEWARCRFRKRNELRKEKSLRKVVIELVPLPGTESDRAMKPLRDGR